jgi:adenosine deaminase
VERGLVPPISLEGPLKFTGLSQFLGFLDWCCGLMRTQEDVVQVAHDFGARAARDGTVYAEVIVNPTHWRSLSPPALIEAIDTGFELAAAEGLTDCRIWFRCFVLRQPKKRRTWSAG